MWRPRAVLVAVGIVAHLGAPGLPCPPRTSATAAAPQRVIAPAEAGHAHAGRAHGHPGKTDPVAAAVAELKARCGCGCGGRGPSGDGVASRSGKASLRAPDPVPHPFATWSVAAAKPDLPEQPPSDVEPVPI